MVAVLDPTALTGFHHGYFAWSAEDEKVIYNLYAEGRTRKYLRAGDYRRACNLNKVRTIMSFGWIGGVL